MKKILSIMLGMSFVLGTVAFAQDTSTDKMSTDTNKTTKKNKKSKKNKKDKSDKMGTSDTTTAPK